MPACHAGDRRFDPGRDRHLILNSEPIPGINSGVDFLFYKENINNIQDNVFSVHYSKEVDTN